MTKDMPILGQSVEERGRTKFVGVPPNEKVSGACGGYRSSKTGKFHWVSLFKAMPL